MTKPKGKGRKTNKKKNKGSGGGGGGGGGVARGNNGNSNSNSNSNNNDSSSTLLLKGEIPDFGSNHNHNTNTKATTTTTTTTTKSTTFSTKSYQTLYSKYKSATRRFIDYMRTHVPNDSTITSSESEQRSSINFLLSASDWMAQTSHVLLDTNILRDLKLCIRMRSRVAQSMFGGGDAGHKYFLEVLVYCWTVLRTLPRAAKEQHRQQHNIDLSAESESYDDNRYSALELDEEEEEEYDEELFPPSAPRPDSTKKPMTTTMTLEELLTSDDRNDAVLFLFSLDELMSTISAQNKMLVNNIRDNRRQGIPESAMVSNLLETAITTNFAIQQVQQLEMELLSQHPHLSTPCRLLATIIMPEVTSNVDMILREHAADANADADADTFSSCSEKKTCEKCDIIAFVGDCIECFFLNPSDDWNRLNSIVPDFCSKYKVNRRGGKELENLLMGIQRLVLLEVPMKMEINGELNAVRTQLQMAGNPVASHSWLPGMEYIGGDRAIHHTIRLLQLFAGCIDSCPPDKKMTFDPRRAGLFGKSPWIAGRRSNKRIRDMDELLMSTLLPEWANMCRLGVVGKMKFPGEDELCPLYVALRSYVDNPRKSVTWSCAFGVHAALTGILEVDMELYEIMKVRKSVFGAYFDQVRNAVKLLGNEETSDMANCSGWKHNVCMVSFLENFGLAAFDERSMWNPLFAGTSLSVLTYFGNLEAGCAVVDCQAQLRIVLYLYHGLLLNGIIQNGQIPLLDHLYDGFKDCKALWQGALPRKGDLVHKFWICFGMSLKESRHMAERAKLTAREGIVPSDIFAEGTKFCRGRKMNPIEPAELATSFRRICERDFSDVRDKYHTPEKRRSSQGSEQYMFAVRTNDTLDHLEHETVLHSTNLISVAYYLEQFVCSLSRVLQWEPHLQPFKESNLGVRQGVAILFAQHLLGALDFARDPMNHEFLDVPMGLAPSSFMAEFFGRIPGQNVLWFQAVAPSGGKVETVTIRR